MEWVLDNWVLVLFGGGMIAMHMFGHGGHGGHASRKSRTSESEPDSKPDRAPMAGGNRSVGAINDTAGGTEERNDI